MSKQIFKLQNKSQS